MIVTYSLSGSVYLFSIGLILCIAIGLVAFFFRKRLSDLHFKYLGAMTTLISLVFLVILISF